ncbi:MAG: carbamoyltransferase [Spirochaetes bacterium]|nr:carbamoyltransferase [Spirochaetota bacterium]
MKDSYILGISALYHDSASVLLKNGEIIAASQEERFTRKKGDENLPINSILYALKVAGITINEVDHIVFYDKPILKFDRILASYIHTAPKGLASFLKALPLWLKSKLWTEDQIKKELGYKKEIYFTEHHQSHSASAFFPSPYDKSAIITIDGAGEWQTTTIGIGEGNKIKILKEINFPNSLGLLYSAFTYYCGFRVNSGEYKLMGLAPYGKPVYLDLIKKELIKINDDGSYNINEKYFNYVSGLKMINKKFSALFGRPPLGADGKPDQFYMDIAASIQELFNEILVKIAIKAKSLTNMDNLVLAGGVALNCVANSKILSKSGFKNVWIQPAAGDAGGALGAALYFYYNYQGANRNTDNINDFQKGSYLGPEFTDEEIELFLKKSGAVYRKVSEDELVDTISDAIINQKVIGWFQGRMEFGPRALGSRSIIGDARSSEMQSVMNLKIKFRESFRPFAPSVLEDKAGEYFDTKTASPYMLLTAQVKKDKLIQSDCEGKTGLELLNLKRSVIPAVTHVDNSARLQTVNEKDNGLYYKLIKKFYDKSGCPVIINTSFNVRGEPIVCEPADAYYCFMGTNIDVLALGSFILFKEEQTPIKDLYKWKKTLIKD